MAYYLEQLEGLEKGRRFDLKAGKNTFGASAGNDFCLSEKGVSHWHCAITVQEDRVLLEDIGSKNGTYVNGNRTSLAELLPGDRVNLSQSTCLELKTDSMRPTEPFLDAGMENGESTLTVAGSPVIAVTAFGERQAGATMTESSAGGIQCRLASARVEDAVEMTHPGVAIVQELPPEEDPEATPTPMETESFPQASGSGEILDTDSSTTSSPDWASSGTLTNSTIPFSKEDVEEIENSLDGRHKQREMLRLLGWCGLLLVVLLACLFVQDKVRTPLGRKNVPEPKAEAAFGEWREEGQPELFSIVYPGAAVVSSSCGGQDAPGQGSGEGFSGGTGNARHEITLQLGKKQKIELYLRLTRESSVDFLQEDFMKGMSDACRRLDKNLMLFESSPMISFFFPQDKETALAAMKEDSVFSGSSRKSEAGRNSKESALNGLRYASSTYVTLRTEERERYYGILYFFRNAGTNYIFQAEVADFNKDMMSVFLEEYPFLLFDNADFIRTAWEGGSALGEVREDFASFRSAFDTCQDAEQFLNYETKLKQFMFTYRKAGKQAQYEEAFGLFLKLRGLQKNYYNKLRIRYQQIMNSGIGKENELRNIREEAARAFGNPEDARYRKIRQDDWQWLSEEDKKQYYEKQAKETKRKPFQGDKRK